MTNFICDSTNVMVIVPSENYMTTAIISIISGIIGAFVGAYFAYYFQKKQMRKQSYQVFIFQMIETAELMVNDWTNKDLWEKTKQFRRFIEIIDFTKEEKKQLNKFCEVWIERNSLNTDPLSNQKHKNDLLRLKEDSTELHIQIIEILKNKL